MAINENCPSEIHQIIARFAPTWPPVIDVSSGWYPLIMELDQTLASIAPDYVIQQVKSKFGSLSFHASPSADPYEYSEDFQDAIRAAEWRSIETCEACGAPAKQYVIRMWVMTLCDRHASEARRPGSPEPS